MVFETVILIVALVALGIGSAALTLEIAQRCSERLLTYHQNQERIMHLEWNMKMFSRLIEQGLSARLHAPTHRAMDNLLHKLSEDTITVDESRTLHRLILERSAELQIAGPEVPDLSLPRMLTLWSLEVRLGHTGQPMSGVPYG